MQEDDCSLLLLLLLLLMPPQLSEVEIFEQEKLDAAAVNVDIVTLKPIHETAMNFNTKQNNQLDVSTHDDNKQDFEK